MPRLSFRLRPSEDQAEHYRCNGERQPRHFRFHRTDLFAETRRVGCSTLGVERQLGLSRRPLRRRLRRSGWWRVNRLSDLRSRSGLGYRFGWLLDWGRGVRRPTGFDHGERRDVSSSARQCQLNNLSHAPHLFTATSTLLIARITLGIVSPCFARWVLMLLTARLLLGAFIIIVRSFAWLGHVCAREVFVSNR